MKKLLGILLLSLSFASASMIGLDALGEEQTAGGMASAAGRGYAGGAKTGDAEGISIVNPARIAFDTKVVFNLNFLYELNEMEKHGKYYGTSNISMPSFNLSFPMGSFGALGVSLWQSYASVMNENFKDSTSKSETEIKYQSSVYEIVPSYALRLPIIRNFALAASAHVVMGNSIRSLTMGPDNSDVAASDSWATNSSKITDYVDGTWEIKDHPAYYTLSAMYRGHQSSYYFSYTTPHTLKNELNYDFRFSELDTLSPTTRTREIKVPAMLGTGMNFRFVKRYNVMMDLQWRPWADDVENIAGSFNMAEVTKTQNDFVASIGLQRDGSPLFYDPYLDRVTYRMGGWYKSWYVKDVYEMGGSIGAGFPLGKKGTTLDVALQGGKRFAENGSDWDEMFFGVRLGLMGIGSWGQTHR